MISSSERLSRCLTTPRREFPWAAIKIFFPALDTVKIRDKGNFQKLASNRTEKSLVNARLKGKTVNFKIVKKLK